MWHKVVWNEPDGSKHQAQVCARSRREAVKCVRRMLRACGVEMMYPRVWKVVAA